MYLAWFDADRKKTTTQKIAEAHQRYVAKFGRQPLVCLVHPEDVVEDETVEIRPLNYIGRNCFWIGADETDERALPEPPAPAMPEATAAPPRRRVARSKASLPVAEPAPVSVPTPLPAPVVVTAPRRTKSAAEPAPVPIPAPLPIPVVVTAPRRMKAKAAVVAELPAVEQPAPTTTKRRTRREQPAA